MTTYDPPGRRIFLTARSCVGSVFRHQGRNPEYGLDCIGLIIYVSKVLGLSGFDITDYRKIPRRDAISAHVRAAGFGERAKSGMMPGDAVILRIGKYLEHAAIISDRGIIHACEKYGGVVEHGLDAEWRSRIISVHSFPDFSHKHQGTV
ncbi:MAG: hypothetical protein COB49_12390 [Alphaproteobacteria bacterium]|nr:MAG: hypothetical protein COB49_12390 [Alphaproteobacteria bacterium]